MESVLNNLLLNSFDALDNSGNLTLELKENTNNITIIISDSGSGISKENIQKVFNPFFSTKPGGNGVGLSLVQQILDFHNARIEVESKINIGTKFTIIFSKDKI